MSHKFKLVKIFNLYDIPSDIINDMFKMNGVIYHNVRKEVVAIIVHRHGGVIPRLHEWLIAHGALDLETVYITPHSGV